MIKSVQFIIAIYGYLKLNNEEKIVNEFDRDGHHYKIGVKADGQVSVYLDDETKAHHGYHFPGVIQIPKGIEIDGQMVLRLPIDCDDAIDQGIKDLKCFKT
ncbi:hypothetical protein LBKG_01691 [Lactobacillus crispatus CTV-05]|nr:hypothetical protein LBKG_01691 [Lactobacillus crispatus CTV-05]